MSEGFQLSHTGKLIICRSDGKAVLGKSFCPPQQVQATFADVVLANCGFGCIGGSGFLWKAKSLVGFNASHTLDLISWTGGALYTGVISSGLVLEKYANSLPQCDPSHYIEDVEVDVALQASLTIQDFDDDECCIWPYGITAIVETPVSLTLFIGSTGGGDCETVIKLGDTSSNLQPCGGTAVVVAV